MCFHPDTKNTQWEDPRLQSPAITGPVSSFLLLLHLSRESLPHQCSYMETSSSSNTVVQSVTHYHQCQCVFAQQRFIALSPRLSLNMPTPLCYSVYHFRYWSPSLPTLFLKVTLCVVFYVSIRNGSIFCFSVKIITFSRCSLIRTLVLHKYYSISL